MDRRARSPSASSGCARILWADLNNDGRVDAVVTPHEGAAYALLQQPGNHWSRSELLPSPDAALRVLLLATWIRTAM